MAVRGPAVARRRQRRRAALWAFVGGLFAGGTVSALGGGDVAGMVIAGVLFGALCAAVAALVVTLLPTTSGGPPGQH